MADINFSDPENHHIIRMCPTSHEAFKITKTNPIIRCSCGWHYEINLSTVPQRYDGVDCVNEMLDAFSRHLAAVKNKWGKFDNKGKHDGATQSKENL